jgi:CheY-like chemotaxis protein
VPPRPATRAVAPLRILAVDDNAVNRRLVQAFLSGAGHRVRLVEGGEQALEALAAEPFDVVLMDVQMPVMDGPTCLRHIRSLEPPLRDLPVIALTANAMAGDRERYLAEGFSDYLSKPMTMQGLAEAIARVAP